MKNINILREKVNSNDRMQFDWIYESKRLNPFLLIFIFKDLTES